MPSDRLTEPDHYALLGVARDADPAAIAAAFRRAARRHHPDRGGSAEEFAAVERAFSVLRDPVARAAYDAELARGGRAGAGDPADDWVDVGWGVPVEPPVRPAAAPSDPAAAGGEDEPPSARDPYRPSPRDPYRPRPAGEAPPPPDLASLTPFGVGSLALPAVDPGEAPTPPVPRWLTPATAVAAGLAWVGLVVVGVALDLGLGWLPVVGLSVFCALAAFLIVRPRRWGELRALVVLGPALSYASGGGRHPADARTVVLLLVAAATLTATAERLRFCHAHGAFRSQIAANARRSAVLDQYARAVEWNRLRDALREPASRVVTVGPVEPRLPAPPGCVPRHCWDPFLGAAVPYAVPAGVGQGSWVVVDRLGAFLAWARPGAPEAWAAVMRTAASASRTQGARA